MIKIKGHSVSTAHYINGERIDNRETFEVFSPITGETIGNVCAGSKKNADDAVAAAKAAFPEWAALGAKGRLPYLQRFAEEIGKREDAFAEVESLDAGTLQSRMRLGIVPRCKLNINWFADAALTLQDRVMETDKATHYVRHDPAGVCAIIIPWNAPLMLSTWKAGPALASGNTIVIKPPEWAPLSISLLADAAHAADLPPGVFNIVQGEGATTGAALVSNPDLSRISFTGSVPTAKIIGKIAMDNLVPCSLELGGKSPFIVLKDADIDLAAKTGALMYRNATQVCLAGTRFLVHQDVRDEFTERMGRYVKELLVGDPRNFETMVGPIIHPHQYKRVENYVNNAVNAGATVLWGGASHDFGDLYYQPTMITDVKQSDPIVQEEVFGPVLVLQTFTKDAEAITMSNDSQYGLGGVCFGETEHAHKISEQIHTGFIWINSFGIRDLAAPFGGCKKSGIGREGGDWSFEFFTDVKDIMIPKQPFVPSFAKR